MSLAEAANLVTVLMVPAAIWWAAVITTKVNALHKAASNWQALAAKVAVLEDRTGGPILVPREQKA